MQISKSSLRKSRGDPVSKMLRGWCCLPAPWLSRGLASHQPLHLVTPLVRSAALTAVLDSPTGREVFLKLENLQPGGSFKIRGMGLTMQRSGANRFMGSSGGNAGLAMAFAARALSASLHLCVPLATPDLLVARLGELGATVQVVGTDWEEAHREAQHQARDTDTFLVHPHSQVDSWEGHSSLVDEVASQLTFPPSLLVCAVGGGGLAMGLLQGLDRHRDMQGWQDCMLLAVETEGAASLHRSLEKREVVRLESVVTVASSLAMRTVLPQLLHYSLLWPGRVSSLAVSDLAALTAAVAVADDERMLVEPACGAAVAAVHGGWVAKMEEEGGLRGEGPIVIVLCGGNLVTTGLVEQWRQLAA